jgi:autotransporter-associated beta strand protein
VKVFLHAFPPSRFRSARAAALALALLAFGSAAHAQLYWDNNGGTAGFGTATGTWAAPTTNNSTQGWSTDATGATLPSSTTTTSTSDALNFGTGSAGLAAGTITVSGTVNANSLTFGSASGNITLSGGTITLGGTTPTITVNNTSDAITSVLAGTAGLTKNGTGTLTLSGTNTYTGGTTVNAGTLSLATAGANGIIRGNLTINQGARVDANATNWSLGYGGTQHYIGNSVSAIAINGGTLNFTDTSNDGGIVAATTVLTGGTISSAGTFAFLSTLTYNQTVQSLASASRSTIASGIALRMNFSPSIGNLIFDVASGTTSDGIDLQVNGGIINATNQGGGNIVKSGSGKLLLAGNNTYTGTTTINAGTLELGGAGQLGSGSYAGAIALNGTGSTLSYNSTAAQTLSGTKSGNGSIVKNGSGNLTISGGASSFSGVTTVNSGTLNIAAGAALSGGSLVINSGATAFGTGAHNFDSGITSITINGGTYLNNDANSYVNAFTGALTMNSGTVNGGASNRNFNPGSYTLSGNNTINHMLLKGGTFNVTNGTTTVTGNITSAITKNGSGSLTLSSSNTYNTTTTINQGTLEITGAGLIGGGSFGGAITNNAILIYSGANAQTFSGVISGTGALTVNGTGTLTLSNAANTYNGSTTVNAGTLAVSGNISSSAITLNSGGVISAGSAAAAARFNAASLTISGDSGYAFTIGNISGGAAGTAGTDYDQIATSGAITFNNTVSNPFTIYINGNPTNWSSSGNYTWNILSGASISGFSASKFVADTSSFQGALAAGASWTFGTSGGNLTLTYGTSGTPTWAGGTGVWSGNFTPSLSNNLNMLFTGAGGVATNDIASGTLSSVGTITFNSTAGSYTLAANSGSAGNGTALTLAGSIINNSASAQTINTALSIGVTRTINTASGNITIGGAISGAGGLTKTGNSTLSLGGNNTFAGATTISAGTLEITSTGLLGGGNYSQNIANSGTFIFGSNSNQTLGGIISGSGALTKNGSGALTLSANNTYTGATTINAGTLQIGAGGTTGSLSTSSAITNNGTLVFNRTDTLTQGTNFASVISGTGNLTQAGAGTLTLSGNNTYTGATTINAGTVQITSTGLLGGGNYTGSIVNSGSLILSSSNAQILGGNISGSGAITKNGSGTLTLSGNNTYSGGTTISGGAVYVGSNSAFGTGNVTLNNISIGSSTAATISNNITLTNTVTVGIGYNTSNLTFSGILSGSGTLNFDTNTSAIITLTGLNTFTSNISAPRTASGIYFNSIANAGVASALGAGSSIGTGVGSYTAALRYTGNVAASTNRAISMGGGGLVIRSDSAALTWTGNITAASSIPLYLQGTAGGGANFNELSGAFLGGSSLIINAGSGNDVWRVSGNNTHTGLTQVTNTSTMIAANANAFGTTAGATQVDTSGQLLLTGGIAVGAEALTLNSNASGTWNGYTGAALRSISGNNSWAGNITLGQASTIATDSGSNLTLSGNFSGANNLTVNSTGNTTISGIIGTSTGTLTKNGTGTLTLSGNNTYTGATTVNAGTLEVSSTGLLGGGSYSGNIANTGTLLLGSNSNQTLSGVISGSGAITKNGTGTLTINNAASTHNGTFTIASGTLAASGNISSSVVLNTGARISAGTAAASAKFNAGSLTIGAGTGYDLTISSVSTSVAGTDYDQIALTGAATFNNTAASQFTIYLNGTPTGWSNTAVYNWDIISATSQSGFTAGNFTLNDTNFGIASGNRTGTWTFSNPSAGIIQLTYSGATGNSTWNTGTASWGTAGSWVENTTPVNFNNLTFNGTGGGTATNTISNATLTTVNNITFASGAGAYTLAASAGSAGATGGTPLSVTGTIINNSSNLQTLSTDLSFGSSRTVNAASGNITISGNISGGGGIIKTGGNTLLLTGNNTYNGTTTINSGTLQVGGSNGNIAGAIVNNANLLYTSSAFGIYGVTGSGNLTINQSSGTVFLQGNITQSGTVNITTSTATARSGMIQTALGTWTTNRMNTSITASAITINGVIGAEADNSRILTLDTSASNGAITLDLKNGSSGTWNPVSIIANAGTGNFTLSGSNAGSANAPWTPDNGNSFTGALNISSSFTSGNLTLNATGNSSVTGNLNFQNGSNAPRVTAIVNPGLSMTISGNITQAASNVASLTKNGTGTLTLSGNNTYTGTTTLNAGTVVIGHANGLGTTGNITFGGGALQYGSGITQDLSSRIKNSGSAILVDTNSNNVTFATAVNSTNSGGLTKNGTGTLTLNATNTYTGTTTINGGTLQIGSAGLLGSGNYSGNISNSGSFVFASNSNQTLSGNISGTGSLTKNGSGVLTLTGTSSFNGGTTINSGTLVVNGSAANSAVTIGNATILAGTGTVGGVTVESGGRLSPGNNAVGNLNASTLTFNGGGGYNWEISNVSGTPGTNWDLITVGGGSGAVTINANAGNKFTVYINGNPTGWDTNGFFSWNIIDWGAVTGFDANAFAVDTTGFTGTAPIGTWAFSNTGGFLNLAYSASDPTWNGASGNWSTGFSPALTTGNKSITFDGAAGGTATNDIPSATVGSVAGITFNSTAGAYTLAADSGSAGYDTTSAMQLNGNILNNSTATQTINLALTSTATRVYDAAAGNLTIGGAISGTGGLTKNGSNLLTLSANNTYTGDTTINAGTLQITSTGLLGGGNYSGNIANNGNFVFGSNSNQILSGVISGTGALTKNGSGTLTLAGNNNYSGNTTLNTGTFVIGHANAAGTGKIFQTDSTSLLKIDTTGTISNNMSVYNVLASQSATLSGAITVNNATWDIETGDTLTISGAISGNGGVTKTGNGTLVLAGNNTYAAPTVVNAGTLNATSAGALGSNKTATVNGGTLRLSHANALSANSTVQVNGGTLLVSANSSINGMNITLNGSSTTVATLSFTGNYSGKINSLTLNQDSIIDLGAAYNLALEIAIIEMDAYRLSIHNWTGKTLWGGGNGTDADQIYFRGGNYTLSNVYFYKGTTSDSFLGTGFDLGLETSSFDPGIGGNQIIPVPEPETWATGILLVLGGSVWLWRKRRNFTTQRNMEGDAPSAPSGGRAPAPIEKMVGLFRRNDPNEGQSRPRALPTNSTTI